MNTQQFRYESKGLVERLRGITGAQIEAIDEEKGDYSVMVSPLSVQYTMDLLNAWLGTNNYELKYNRDLVKWTLVFNVNGKRDSK